MTRAVRGCSGSEDTFPNDDALDFSILPDCGESDQVEVQIVGLYATPRSILNRRAEAIATITLPDGGGSVRLVDMSIDEIIIHITRAKALRARQRAIEWGLRHDLQKNGGGSE